jgi:hypothetical protein
MVEAAWSQLEDFDPVPFTDGEPEQTLVWQEDDVTCRARLDWLHNIGSRQGIVDDYKTTARGAEPASWIRSSLFGNGYDVRAAFYLRGLERVTGKTGWFRWIVQEKQPPYALSVISPGPDVLAVADAKVEYAIKRWRECLQADEWPAYPREVCFAELPPWEEARWLEREAREAA